MIKLYLFFKNKKLLGILVLHDKYFLNMKNFDRNF